ncbi:MAG: DNA polymerase III subunit gamma/tau, partial [Dethiobacteria bacterium]
MSYRSMYRRWRPAKFAEMVGQEHIRQTLQNALKSKRVSHAYLFCGPRGTGKTTTAKILAKAVNCINGPSTEPCGQCPACLSIAEGRTMDVLEIDAASNRGIDEIRELREKVRYNPSEFRCKVYIIDEVHMLTNEAFNALLKTLEEPPRGVIFILATTEPHKVPPTIVSRCQRFDFRLLTAAEISLRLHEASTQEGWQVDEHARLLIARLAEGSMRDAFGLLEQCRAYVDGVIKVETVQELFGVTAPQLVNELTMAIADDQPHRALQIIEEIVFGGKDLALFIRDLTLFLSRLLLLAAGSSLEQVARDLPEFKSFFEASRGRFTYEALLEMIAELNNLMVSLRHTCYPHFMLEMAVLRLIKINRYIGQQSIAAIIDKLAALEEKVAALNKGRAADQQRLLQSELQSERLKSSQETAAAHSLPFLQAEERSKENKGTHPLVESVDSNRNWALQRLKKYWPQLLRQIKSKRPQAYAWLEYGKPLAV